MDSLDKIAAGAPEREKYSASSKPKVWHEMLVDFFLLNPTATNIEAAEQFDVTDITIGRVKNSDMFQMIYRQRRQEFEERVNGTAIERLKGKIAGTAEVAIDLLRDKIEKEREVLGIDATADATDMLLKHLGFAAPQKAQQTNVNVTVVSSSDLAEARERMNKVQVVQVEALPAK